MTEQIYKTIANCTRRERSASATPLTGKNRSAEDRTRVSGIIASSLGTPTASPPPLLDDKFIQFFLYGRIEIYLKIRRSSLASDESQA